MSMKRCASPRRTKRCSRRSNAWSHRRRTSSGSASASSARLPDLPMDRPVPWPGRHRSRQMLSLEQIEQLEAFDAGGARVLSVYLSLTPDRQLKHAYRTVFKDLVREALGQRGKGEREALQRERDQVQSWLDEHEPDGKGLALFSCSPKKLFQAHWLPVPVQDHLAFDPGPDVAPLLE